MKQAEQARKISIEFAPLVPLCMKEIDSACNSVYKVMGSLKKFGEPSRGSSEYASLISMVLSKLPRPASINPITRYTHAKHELSLTKHPTWVLETF